MDLADLQTLQRQDRAPAGAPQRAAPRARHGGNRAATLYDQLAAIAPKVLPYMDSVWSLLDDKRREGKRILFEGAQGALLDIDHGTYPYVTSSNTVAAQAATGSGIGPMRSATCSASPRPIRRGSARARSRPSSSTRSARRSASAGKEFGTVTGRPRRCGWFDAVLVRQTVRTCGIDGHRADQARHPRRL